VSFVGVFIHQSNHLKDVEKRVVVGFDCERRLTAIARNPAKSQHCFQRQVLVAVDEVALHQVFVLAEFGVYLRLKSVHTRGDNDVILSVHAMLEVYSISSAAS